MGKFTKTLCISERKEYSIMEGPIITVDVSKGSCHYRPFIENGHPMRKPKSLSATIDGFQKLGQTIKDLEAKTEREDIPVIFEATGVYHRPLQKYLEDHKIRYYIISPLLSATYRKTDLHSNKTDALDCAHIAKAYYCEKELRQYQAQPQEYKRLYQLSRIYESELVHLRKRKVSLRSMLDIIYPRIDRTFKGNQNLYDPIPMEILKRYPHPSLLLSHREDTIVKTVGHRTGHLKGYTERIVHKIYEKAKECYSGCDIDDIEVVKLPTLIENMQEQKKKCNSLLKEMIEIARTCPYFASVVSIVGIGENLAARIIAELGDVNRFDNRAAIVAYADLNPKIQQSGDIDGLHLKISKKGNKHLRCLLYLGAQCNYRLRKEDPLYEFTKKKRQQTQCPLSSKAAYTASAHKLLVIIYSLCKNGTLYHS